MAYNGQQRYDLAIREFTRAIGLDAGSAQTLYHRGMTTGFWVRTTRPSTTSTPPWQSNRTMAKPSAAGPSPGFESGEYEEALRDFDKLIELMPGQSDAYYGRACAYAFMNQPLQAIDDFGRSIPPGSGTRPLPTQPGAIYLNKDEPGRAVQDFDRVISLQPDNAEAHLYRGKALARLDNYDAAVRDFGRAIELDPGDAESYYVRESARIELGEYYGTIEDLEEAVRVNPQHPYADSGRKVAAELLESTKAEKNAGKG